MTGQECQNCKHWNRWENGWGRCGTRTDRLDLTKSFDGVCCHYYTQKEEPKPEPKKIEHECQNCKRWRGWDDVWGRCARRDSPPILTMSYQGEQCSHYQEGPRKDQELT